MMRRAKSAESAYLRELFGDFTETTAPDLPTRTTVDPDVGRLTPTAAP
jgi:hypothetical protein